MKKTAYLISLMLLAGLAGLAVLMTGCGSDQGESAPSGATITINGATDSTTVPAGVCAGLRYDYQTFAITVLDSLNRPMNNIAIVVDLDWAPNSADPAMQVMALIDADVNPAVPVAVPYRTKTDDFGTKNVTVRRDLGGCTYKGNLKVFSGTAFNSVSIEVAN